VGGLQWRAINSQITPRLAVDRDLNPPLVPASPAAAPRCERRMHRMPQAVAWRMPSRMLRLARRMLGVVPQELVFDPFFSVREALRFQSGYFGIQKNDAWIDELLAHLGLTDKANANMRQLSGGMKRRVLVAQALVHKPRVIVLDEPTAGVDVELRQTLWQFIAKLNREGHTVLLTTHYLEEAEALCSRLAMLKQGQVVALESTSALLARAASNVLRFKTDATLPPDLAAQARITGRVVQLPANDALAVERVLARLRELGVVPQDMEIRKADLEDVFLELTGSHAPTRSGVAA
jgi:ABC-2 type transport system ATP-binding protein